MVWRCIIALVWNTENPKRYYWKWFGNRADQASDDRASRLQPESLIKVQRAAGNVMPFSTNWSFEIENLNLKLYNGHVYLLKSIFEVVLVSCTYFPGWNFTFEIKIDDCHAHSLLNEVLFWKLKFDAVVLTLQHFSNLILKFGIVILLFTSEMGTAVV